MFNLIGTHPLRVGQVPLLLGVGIIVVICILPETADAGSVSTRTSASGLSSRISAIFRHGSLSTLRRAMPSHGPRAPSVQRKATSAPVLTMRSPQPPVGGAPAETAAVTSKGTGKPSMLKPAVRSGKILSVLVPSSNSPSSPQTLLQDLVRRPTSAVTGATSAVTSAVGSPGVGGTVRAATAAMPSVATSVNAPSVLNVAQTTTSLNVSTSPSMSGQGVNTDNGRSALAVGVSVTTSSLDATGNRQTPPTIDQSGSGTGTGTGTAASSNNFSNSNTTGTLAPPLIDPTGVTGGTASGGGRGPHTASTATPSGSSTATPSESSSGGAYGRTIEDCMSVWDPTTHLTKDQWRAACARTITR